MAIPRDRVCWYCERGEHEKCGVPKTCACRSCYSALFTDPTLAPAVLAPACALCQGVCSWACFSKRPEASDALSQAASFYTP